MNTGRHQAPRPDTARQHTVSPRRRQVPLTLRNFLRNLTYSGCGRNTLLVHSRTRCAGPFVEVSLFPRPEPHFAILGQESLSMIRGRPVLVEARTNEKRRANSVARKYVKREIDVRAKPEDKIAVVAMRASMETVKSRSRQHPGRVTVTATGRARLHPSKQYQKEEQNVRPGFEEAFKNRVNNGPRIAGLLSRFKSVDVLAKGNRTKEEKKRTHAVFDNLMLKGVARKPERPPFSSSREDAVSAAECAKVRLNESREEDESASFVRGGLRLDPKFICNKR